MESFTRFRLPLTWFDGAPFLLLVTHFHFSLAQFPSSCQCIYTCLSITRQESLKETNEATIQHRLILNRNCTLKRKFNIIALKIYSVIRRQFDFCAGEGCKWRERRERDGDGDGGRFEFPFIARSIKIRAKLKGNTKIH